MNDVTTTWLFTDVEWQAVATRVAGHIVDAGHQVQVFDPARAPDLAVEISGSDLQVHERGQQLDEPDAVVVLRSPIPDPGDGTMADPDAAQFVRSQWAVMFAGLYRALELRGAMMLNPTIAAASDEKTHQMLAAAHAGLTTLPTTQTARSADVAHRWPNDARLAMKPFQPVVRRELREGRQKMIRTVALPADELAAGLDGSRVKCPTIVQPFVPAAFEHRVVVVGDKVHGARFEKVGAAKIDIRSVPVSELSATPSELPDDVAAACVRLVRSVGAVIAAIDLLETNDGFVFLDLNCSGHYLYVEQLTSAPICADIAELAVASGPGPDDGYVQFERGMPA